MKALGQMPGASLDQPEPVLRSPETLVVILCKGRDWNSDGLESSVHGAESFLSKIPHPKSVPSHPPTPTLLALGQGLGPLCTLVGNVDAICGQENKIIINE